MSAILSRERARLTGERQGPTLIVVGGIHGNEPAGLEAAAVVTNALPARSIAGEVVVFAGNVGALAEGRRYLAHDLNRVWTKDLTPNPLSLKGEGAQSDYFPTTSNPSPDASLAPSPLRERGVGVRSSPEIIEMHALHSAIEEACARARGPVFLVDLHTSSASGVPFAMSDGAERGHAFMAAFPLPRLRGLLDHVEGVLTSYWTARGLTCLSVEGGQHDDPSSREALAAVLWIALASAGIIAAHEHPEVAASRQRLDELRGELPRLIDVVGRHAITADDAFVMEPGFRNLHAVRAGQRLARDRRGPIDAPEDGVVVLPLYQPHGEDGFFWGRPVV